MNNGMDEQREMFKLLLLELNGSCSQEDFSRLNQQLKSSPQMVDMYVEFMILYSALTQSQDKAELQVFESVERDRCIEPALWAQLAREELCAPAVEVKKDPDTVPGPRLHQQTATHTRTYSKGYLWFSIISTAASLLFFLYVWTHPRHFPVDVATVTDIYQAQWDRQDATIQKGTRLFDDRKVMNLTRGVMKVQFDGGVRVVVQSPAAFSIDSDSTMRLNHGKVYARVPKQAIGFRIDTPNCGVIDMGTEFGVDVTDRGETNVLLFKGKASLVTSSQDRIQRSQVLLPNEAKRVNSSGEIRAVSFQKQRFVRDFDSDQAVLWNGQKLSLANIASGGSGWGKSLSNRGIDQKTGRLVTGNIENRSNEPVPGYVAVPQLPYVDGVFVPDGGEGAVQLTSAGHTFDNFGDTAGGYFMAIGSYTKVNMVDAGSPDQFTNIHLKEYPEQTSTNLCLHANSGITFDLQRIRESVPFAKITHFSSVYGIPATREDQGQADADFYVFVDGEPRMVKEGMTSQDEPGHVTVPLTETDQFLTLACTEGAGNFGDWSLFVNPELELELAE